jgi:hypothetical protein
VVTPAESSIVVSHVATAGLSVAFIQWLKNSPYFPWVTAEKKRIVRAVALVTAAIGTVGIHYAWNPTARVLSFEIPTLAVLYGAVVHYVTSFVIQELTYQTVKQPDYAALIKAAIVELEKNRAAGENPAAKQ